MTAPNACAGPRRTVWRSRIFPIVGSRPPGRDRSASLQDRARPAPAAGGPKAAGSYPDADALEPRDCGGRAGRCRALRRLSWRRRPPHAAKRPPNIVLITTDDQPLSTFEREYMPRTFEQLVDRGTSFSDAVVNVPVCCPSRASLLTGQYPHNHGIFTNSPGYADLRDKRDVLPAWLGEAGYRTGHFGKWLHGYEKLRKRKPAPGWDRWYTQLKKRNYYDYKLSSDGKRVERGHRPKDHITGLMTRKASQFIGDNVERRRPLYVQLDYYAPHVGSRTRDAGRAARCNGAPTPGPREDRTILEGGAPRGPAFNEEEINDKPAFSRTPLLGAAQDQRARPALPLHARVDRRRRPRHRPRDQGVQAGRRDAQHGLHLPHRQRLLLRRAPDRRRQGPALGGGDPDAAGAAPAALLGREPERGHRTGRRDRRRADDPPSGRRRLLHRRPLPRARRPLADRRHAGQDAAPSPTAPC